MNHRPGTRPLLALAAAAAACLAVAAAATVVAHIGEGWDA